MRYLLRETHRTVAPPVATARFWRRRERRAVAAHDRQLLEALRHAAAGRVPVLAARAAAARPDAPTALGVAELALPGARLQLVAVTPAAQRAITEIAGPAWMAGAGRYGSFWWVVLASRHSRVVVLAGQVRLIRPGGDLHAPVADDPGGQSRAWLPATDCTAG
jgi:hypothetical protein